MTSSPKLRALCRRLRDEAVLPAIREFITTTLALPTDDVGITVVDEPDHALFGAEISGLAPFRFMCLLGEGPCGRADCSFYLHMGNRPRAWRQAVVALARWFGPFPARMLVEPEQQRGGALQFTVSQSVFLRDADLVRGMTADVMAAGFRLARFIDLWLPDTMDWSTAAYVHDIVPGFATADLHRLLDAALAAPSDECDLREAYDIALALGRDRDARRLLRKAKRCSPEDRPQCPVHDIARFDNKVWAVVARAFPPGERDEILDVLEQETTVWPRVSAVPSFARLLLDRGRHRLLLDLTAAEAADRPYPLGWFRGQALLALDHPTEARAEFDACLADADPNDYRMRGLLASCLGVRTLADG